MFTLFGIVLLVAGAILTFAIDRQVDGVDLQLVGWILMSGGGLSLFVGMSRAAVVATVTPRRAPHRAPTPIGDGTERHGGRHPRQHGPGQPKTGARPQERDAA